MTTYLLLLYLLLRVTEPRCIGNWTQPSQASNRPASHPSSRLKSRCEEVKLSEQPRLVRSLVLLWARKTDMQDCSRQWAKLLQSMSQNPAVECLPCLRCIACMYVCTVIRTVRLYNVKTTFGPSPTRGLAPPRPVGSSRWLADIPLQADRQAALVTRTAILLEKAWGTCRSSQVVPVLPCAIRPDQFMFLMSMSSFSLPRPIHTAVVSESLGDTLHLDYVHCNPNPQWFANGLQLSTTRIPCSPQPTRMSRSRWEDDLLSPGFCLAQSHYHPSKMIVPTPS